MNPSNYMKTASTSLHAFWSLIFTCTLYLGFNSTATAQNKMGTGLVGSASLMQDGYNPILSFSPIHNEGKTYVRWLVTNDEKDGIFIVERSADGQEFEALGFKDRVGSPLCVNLFYSFVDEAPIPGENYYRIMTVGTDQTFSYSAVVRVNSTSPITAAPSSAALENGKE
jgi:hypothetical protein